MTEPVKGEQFAERYTLERELGRGGMGAVWAARDEKLERPVAVKLMAPKLADDPTALERFEREAKAVAMLHSPHIVDIHDYGIDRGRAYIVMELLRGRDASVVLREERALPLITVARIVEQTAKALTTAHEAGVVHRDLKPANIFLVRHHDEDFVKVFDFGIAKIFSRPGRQVTSIGALVGTPHYMSPEHLHAEQSDPRDDVWALSVIAFRLLTGAHPFPGRDLAAVVQKILERAPKAATSYRPDLDAAVDRVFERAFAREQKDRFQTPRELAAALLALVPERLSLSSAAGVVLRVVDDATTVSTSERTTVPLEATQPTWPTAPPTTLHSSPSRRSLPMFVVGGGIALIAGGALAWWVTRGASTPTGESAASSAEVAPTNEARAPAAPGTAASAVSHATASASATAVETPPARPSVAPRTPRTSPQPHSAPPVPSAPRPKGDDLFDGVF